MKKCLIENAAALISDVSQLPDVQLSLPLRTPVKSARRNVKRLYKAGEIGDSLGISANKIGRIANKYNLKTEKYGTWVFSKIGDSNREFKSFQYNEAGKKKITELLKQEKKK